MKIEKPNVGISTNSLHFKMRQMVSPTGRPDSELVGPVLFQQTRSEKTERIPNSKFVEFNSIMDRPSILDSELNQPYDDEYIDQANAYNARMLCITISMVMAFLMYLLTFILVLHALGLL